MQTEKKKKNQTQYGEFVSSEFHWIPRERQKERAEELEKITKKKNK